MKKVTTLLAAFALSASVHAQTWNLDKAHARLGFTITHMMVSDVDGMFKQFDASIQSSKPDFSDATFTLTAQTASVYTDNDQRDTHLRSADFFDAAKNPTITFRSTSLKKMSANSYKVTGNLTMHGITKPVTLDLSFRGPANHPMMKKPFAGFKATGKVKRSDFNIGTAGMTDAMLGNEVAITANGEFIQG
jgi:polyisoprenoid-binding protein YceI